MTEDRLQTENDEYLAHPFTREEAIEFVKRGPLNSWMKGVCLSRIDNPDSVEHPRLLMMKIMEYVEINLKEARNAREAAVVCSLCQYGFEARNILFQKDDILECNPMCEYFNAGYAEKG